MGRLKDLRKEKGYSQIVMQHLTGIDQSDYSKIETGKRYFTFEQCRKIAIALNTSMDYFAFFGILLELITLCDSP